MRHARLFGALLLCVAVTPHAAWSYDLDYVMVNNTNQPIVRMWSSPSTASRYYESTNVYVPRNGGKQRQTYNRGATGSDCYYDIKVQFQGGRQAEINHVNLCSVHTITMDVDGDGDITYATD